MTTQRLADRPRPVPWLSGERAVVLDAMVVAPVTHARTTTLEEARAELAAPHRHLVLIVAGRRLLGTVAREDLDGGGSGPALDVARLAGRTTRPDDDLARVRAEMAASGERRRAVVDGDGTLVGLLCLKASGTGFCSDEGIAARHETCRDVMRTGCHDDHVG